MSSPHAAVAVPYIVEVVAFLVSVVVIVPLFKRLNISPILGYLAIGTVIGPHSLGVVTDVAAVQHVAELGVIFLLFAIGLELSFERLKAFSKLIFGLGFAQVILCGIVIGAVAFAWGNSAQVSIVIGMCLALSSTAMTLQVLKERGESASEHGRATFAVLLFQDLAVVPILILLSVFGGSSDDSIVLAVIQSLARAVIAVLLIVLIGRFFLRYLFRVAAGTKSTDVFMATMLLTILAISLITGLAGLSMALGAFLAGLLLAETEFRLQVESEIEPFKGLLLGLFFMSVGMNIDFSMAFERGLWVFLSVIGLLGLKIIVISLLARFFLGQWGVSVRTAILLAEGGEFAFVVIGQATLIYNIIPEAVGQFMVVVAGLSMMLTPLLAWLGEKAQAFIDPRGASSEVTAEDTDKIAGHVIILGFGRVGRAVAAVLKDQGVSYIAFDLNVEHVRVQAEECGEPIFYGDATRGELLERAGVAKASVVLITMDNEKSANQVVHLVTRQWPHVSVLVRTHDAKYAQQYLQAGAAKVVPETLEVSLQLSAYVLRELGMERAEANAVLEVIRRHGYSEMTESV